MTWICKKCGQIQPDSIIYGDGICDDCFEKINKKKKKGSAFNKILSLALVLSFMLCIFSGFGVAYAVGNFLGDTSALEFDGTYMGYDVIKYDENFSITFAQLQNLIIETAPEGTTKGTWYLTGALLQFDESGQPIIYSTDTEGYAISCKADFSNLKDDPYDSTFMYAFFKCMTSKSSYSFNKQYGSYTDLYWSYGASDIKVNLVNKNLESTVHSEVLTHTNLAEGFNGFVGLGDVYLLLYISDQSYTQNAIASQLLAGSKSDFVSNKTADYSAKFHSFVSMNDNSDGMQNVLNMIDWLGMGKQYPIVDFSINDNSKNHSYSLRISSNSNYSDVCMQAWEDYKTNNISSTVGNVVGVAITAKLLAQAVAGKVIIGTLGPIGLCLITVPTESGTADAVRKIAQVNLLESLDDLSYKVEYNLTSSYLQFNEGESSSRAYSVCLPDYLSIVKGLVYKLEIVDNNTGLILDKAYFCDDTTFAKTNTGYGTKVYNYSDYDDLLGDVDGGNGYVNNDSYTQGDSLQNDNPNDIVDWDKYNQYDFSNMQNLAGTLNSATAGLGGFFMACFNVIPPAFISLLLGTFTLVIILRVLGR